MAHVHRGRTMQPAFARTPTAAVLTQSPRPVTSSAAIATAGARADMLDGRTMEPLQLAPPVNDAPAEIVPVHGGSVLPDLTLARPSKRNPETGSGTGTDTGTGTRTGKGKNKGTGASEVVRIKVDCPLGIVLGGGTEFGSGVHVYVARVREVRPLGPLAPWPHALARSGCFVGWFHLRRVSSHTGLKVCE